MNPSSTKLVLFVDLDSALGLGAVTNLSRFLSVNYPGCEPAEIIDTRSSHGLLVDYKVTATPCLIICRDGASPIKLIGDLGNIEKLHSFFDQFLGEIQHD